MILPSRNEDTPVSLSSTGAPDDDLVPRINEVQRLYAKTVEFTRESAVVAEDAFVAAIGGRVDVAIRGGPLDLGIEVTQRVFRSLAGEHVEALAHDLDVLQ